MRRSPDLRRRGPWLLLAAFVMACLGLEACSDNPSPLESLSTRFTDVDVTIVVDTLEAISATTFRDYLSMNGPVNLAGRTGGYEAFTLVQFANFPERDTVNVLSAQLHLHAVTWFGDSSGMLALTAHRIMRSWSPFTLTWDTVQSGGFHEEGIVRGTITAGIASDTETLVLNLDTALVREWLSQGSVNQYGIILKPGVASTVVRGFTGFGADSIQFNPTLTIIAQNVAGTVTDTSEYSLGSDTFVGNIDNPVIEANRIFTQAGVVYRTKLTFDASAIPAGAIVNRADLLLTRDLQSSKLSKFSADTLVAAHVLTTGVADSSFELAGSLARSTDGGTILAFDVRHAAQLWVNGINNGLLVRASSSIEFSSSALHVFYGPSFSEPAWRPKVRVLYTLERRE